MIHEIEPYIFDNSFRKKKAEKGDYGLYYDQNKVLLFGEENKWRIPTMEELLLLGEKDNKNAIVKAKVNESIDEFLEYEYLFSLDGASFFHVLSIKNFDRNDEMEMEISNIQISFQGFEVFRDFKPQHLAFAGITGAHIHSWRNNRKFCGSCGGKMDHSEKERALICTDCGLVEYPKISPAVIVAIIDQDKILLTKYARGVYKKYALVAGFVEVGESFEEAVKREVLEEVGLRVKNIRYYKSQPWGFSDSVMIGFFADLDGDNTITLQEDELSEGVWCRKEEIPEAERNISIGQEMIECFRNGMIL